MAGINSNSADSAVKFNEEYNAKRRSQYMRDRERINARRKQWRKDHPEEWKAYMAAWREKNRDKIRAYQKKDIEKRKKKIREYGKQWYLKNRDRTLKKNKENRDRNKHKIRERVKKYNAENRDKIAARNLRRSLLEYNISAEEYTSLLFLQGGTCAICKTKPNGRRLGVDHDHKTGNVRGLLCNACNLAIGYMRDNAEFLKNAIEYLQCVNP